MLLDLIRSRKAEIDQLARRYGARRLRVFGSVARREEGPESDVDFLVDFPPGMISSGSDFRLPKDSPRSSGARSTSFPSMN
jgi:predicted nucleotidyltransferase